MDSLYKRHNWLNKNIPYMFSESITEYDIESGGFNVIKQFKLTEQSFIDRLENMSKKKRQKQIGLYIRGHKGFAKIHNKGFEEARRLFIESNKLQESDIISIKKDAIITNKKVNVTEFGNIKFVEKNCYHTYLYLNDIEFYFNSKRVDVKGINDDYLDNHRDYMLDFLTKFMNIIKNGDKQHALKVLREFAKVYKNRELDIGYYRELNRRSCFKTNMSMGAGTEIYMEYLDDHDTLDITYNYFNIILALIKLFI